MKNLLSICFSLIFANVIFAQNQWVQKASIPGNSERHHPVTWAFGDTAYVLTGTTGAGTSNFQSSDFFMYTDINDSWETLSDFPGPARSFAYGNAYEGKGYIGFGASQFDGYLNDLWEYDPVTQNWTELATCPCSGRRHPAFAINSGKIFVGLGDDANGNLNDWWAYDIATDTWGQMPNLPGPVRHHPFHFAQGDFVYAGMGHGSPFIYDDWYRFDPSDSTWTTMNVFPGESRVAGTEFSHLDKGYVLSGQGSDHSYLDEGEFWEYDPETDSWLELTAHPGAGRWAPGSFVLNNMVYFVAGEDNQGLLRKDMWAYQLPEPEEPEEPVDTTTTEINEVVQSEIKVYPNPAQNRIYMDLDIPAGESFNVSIFNAQGQLMKSRFFENNGMDISDLSAGVYILIAENGKGIRKQARFVKQ